MTTPLDNVTAAFNHWRTHRTKRSKIPHHLTEQAIALVGQYSKAEITRSLRINHSMLNQWLECPSECSDFIALPVVSDASADQSVHNRLSITVHLANGAEMTIQGSAEQAALLIGQLQQRGH